MSGLNLYNKLPPRPEHITAVTNALDGSSEMTLYELTKKCGLTKTQTGCALSKLLSDGLASGSGSPQKFKQLATVKAE